MSGTRPFHLAFPVTDLAETRQFYGETLGCQIGRESPGHWVDFSLYGHQLSAHLRPQSSVQAASLGLVDGDAVPIPHFGVIVTMEQWKDLAARLEANPQTRWGMRPKVRFVGEPGEQATLFFFDPSGNALEFKAFADDSGIFQTA